MRATPACACILAVSLFAVSCTGSTGKQPERESVVAATPSPPDPPQPRAEPEPRAQPETKAPPAEVPDEMFGPMCRKLIETVAKDCPETVKTGVCEQARNRVVELRHLRWEEVSYEGYDWICEPELEKLTGKPAKPRKPAK